MGGNKLGNVISTWLGEAWQLTMSVRTGHGKEEYLFPVVDFSPLRFIGVKDQLWFEQYNQNIYPRLLLDLIKFVGESHTLTIVKHSDIASRALFQTYSHKRRFPSVSLRIERESQGGTIGATISFVEEFSGGPKVHNVVFMPDASITHFETHTRYRPGFSDDEVTYFDYVTLKVRDAFILSS